MRRQPHGDVRTARRRRWEAAVLAARVMNGVRVTAMARRAIDIARFPSWAPRSGQGKVNVARGGRMPSSGRTIAEAIWGFRRPAHRVPAFDLSFELSPKRIPQGPSGSRSHARTRFSVCYRSPDTERSMSDELPTASANRELTAKIVAAYVRGNQIGADQVASLISTVQEALAGLGRPAEPRPPNGSQQCRSGDPSITIMWSVSTAGGAARRSGGTSLEPMG